MIAQATPETAIVAPEPCAACVDRIASHALQKTIHVALADKLFNGVRTCWRLAGMSAVYFLLFLMHDLTPLLTAFPLILSP